MKSKLFSAQIRIFPLQSCNRTHDILRNGSKCLLQCSKFRKLFKCENDLNSLFFSQKVISSKMMNTHIGVPLLKTAWRKTFSGDGLIEMDQFLGLHCHPIQLFSLGFAKNRLYACMYVCMYGCMYVFAILKN